MSGGPPVIRRATVSKSNVELINSLRANFLAAQESSLPPNLPTNASITAEAKLPQYSSWTTREGDVLYIPSIKPTPLAEPRESYDITVKLFYLPGIPPSRRCAHTKEAIALVLKELGVSTIDLLIVSYPGISFDADDDVDEDLSEDEGSSQDSEASNMETMVQTWRTLESLKQQGLIDQLGVSEFGSGRLAKFLPETKIKPSVDQINVKDCCVVPKTLILYAKENNIELLTHNDCTDILPPGTTRELLGPGEKGAGVLAATAHESDDDPGLKGDIEPQWVVKYTAVVKDRGVIENKGYFALAQVGSCVEPGGRVS
jgi:glutamate--cysteine ligase regulatory subunit